MFGLKLFHRGFGGPGLFESGNMEQGIALMHQRWSDVEVDESMQAVQVRRALEATLAGGHAA